MGTRSARWGNIYDLAGPLYTVLGSNSQSVEPHSCVGCSFAEVITDLSRHPETKSLGPGGMPYTCQTAGLLQRMEIEVVGICHIGKEANELELVQAESILLEDEVLATYKPNARGSIQPVLQQMPASRIQNETGCSLREIHHSVQSYLGTRPVKGRAALDLIVADLAGCFFGELRTGWPSLNPFPLGARRGRCVLYKIGGFWYS